MRWFLFIALLICAQLHGQDKTLKDLKSESEQKITKDAADTIPRIWKKGGLVSVNLAQTSLSNWAAGGDNFSLSVNSIVNLFAFYKKGKSSWDNTVDLEAGYLKTTSLGGRKNNDKIDLLSKYDYAISSNWNVSGLFNFRSQMFRGYDYSDNPKKLTSAFLSPGYVLISAGLDFKPDDHFAVFISPITARETIVKNDSISAKGLYGVDSGEHHRFEFGAFLSASYKKDFSPIISYTGRLDLFSNYLRNPQDVDLIMSNVFAAKLSKWLSATWSLDLVYDDDAKLFGKNGHSPALQAKSLVGLGVLLKF